MSGTDLCDVRALLFRQPFVQAFDITVVSATPGFVVVEMPFAERLSTPPGLFPAGIVGTLGDIAAVSSCPSLLPDGWAAATLDFTVKMVGKAQGETLRGRGRVLQAGKTLSVGAAEVFCVTGGRETLCGAILATSRNFPIKT